LDTELAQQLAFPRTSSSSIPDPLKRGILNWSNDDLFKMVKKYHDAGRQISIHVQGERAADQALNAYSQVMKPGDDWGHHFEHLSFVTEDQIKVCGELGVVSSFFVDQIYYYGHTFSDHIFREERTAQWTHLAAAMEHIGELSLLKLIIRHFLVPYMHLLASRQLLPTVTDINPLGKGIASQLIKPSMHTPYTIGPAFQGRYLGGWQICRFVECLSQSI